MITLEQIRLLESKVHKTVARMAALREENSALRQKLDTYEQRITELEGMVTAFKEDQAEIEHGIITALEKLDELEDAATDAATESQAATASSSAADEDIVALEDSELPDEEPSEPGISAIDAEPASDTEESTDEATEEDDGPSPTEGELDIF